MGKFKNRIWTNEDYLMFYEKLNSPETLTIYKKDYVLCIRCDGELITTREEYDKLKMGPDNIHFWEIERRSIDNYKFVETIEGIIICSSLNEAKQYLKKGVSDCKRGQQMRKYFIQK